MTILLGILSISLIFLPPTWAADGDLDPSFDPGTGVTDGTVYAVAVQPDGSILIGGNFTTVRGQHLPGIARFQSSGYLDSAFQPGSGVNGTVRSIALQPDGKILIAGNFDMVNGKGRTSLARLDYGGTPDDSFNPVVLKMDSSIGDLYKVVYLSDNQILIGGHFRWIGAVSRSYVARLNLNGTLDPSFDAKITINNGTTTIAKDLIEVSGQYLVGGYVTYEGLARGFFTRLTHDGALDPSFTPESVSPNVVITTGDVYGLARLPDGRIVIGGWFGFIKQGVMGEPQRHGLARFSATGALDAAFVPDPGAEYDEVFCLALQSDRKILIGGWFTKYDNVSRNRVARILSDGKLDVTFNPGIGVEGSGYPGVYAITKVPGAEKWLLGGKFTTYNGVSRAGIVQITAASTFFSQPPLMLLLE